jgi:hypothetical protein
MSEKPKTSVEQFAIALYEGGYLQGNGDEIQKLLEQHLEMEKERMIEFGCLLTFESKHIIEEDYNEIYGGNK